MAVKDESLHHVTDTLILPTPRKYYRAHIHTSHWQLRSLISSPTTHNVYYPTGNDIIRLNTLTREREVITTLAFSPRCLTAAKGFLCCGGDKGEFTAIPLDEEGEFGEGSLLREFNEGLAADADARLPLDLDPPRRSTPLSRHTVIMRRLRGLNNPMSSNIKSIGTEIVNCITIWMPPPALLDEVYKMPVAVVANNDCSVCILDLQDSETLDRLSFPDFVNRAVMSPDGQLLIAICDDPFMYIHTRKPKTTLPKTAHLDLTKSLEYEWVLSGKVQLEGQRQADKSSMRGSFAAAFSKSGSYLAVATQYGIISVFHVASLLQDDCDPLLTLFTSSRPNSDSTSGSNAPGAIRAMEFSPEPYDLLAWTEANGRVGVADVRDLFYSRQTINLDSHAEGVDRVVVTDRAIERLEPLIDPRLRSFRSETPATPTPDYLGLDLEGRHLRTLSRGLLDRNQSPLTAEEMQVLEAHRVARRERDAEREAGREALARSRAATERVLARAQATAETVTRQIHTWGPWDDPPSLGTSSSDLTATERASAIERNPSTSGLPSSLREFVSGDRSAASFRAFINERNQDRERRGQSQQPRRRGSIILAAAQSDIERLTRVASREPSYSFSTQRDRADESQTAPRSRSVTRDNDSEPSSSLERLRLDPPRLPALSTDPPDPWAEIESLYNSHVSGDSPVETTTRLRVETDDDDRRDFAHRLRQPWRPFDEFAQVGTLTRLGGRYEGTSILRGGSLRSGSIVDTMGCSWSEDGRILYVGAEDGIHEFHVNVQGRKMFPSLVLR
ncbi:hypothetical protein BP5796_02229 [Coleophoma crateriformis]|uniref:DUF2415 domain-containing protein n=1 Tax=Coleophoma crateriformis TaxID=565419 RepID=A0A3D8SXQ6_9HELO|nr:hypothetical protein BP5796_02229 [Coleophoma crateriformis]